MEQTTEWQAWRPCHISVAEFDHQVDMSLPALKQWKPPKVQPRPGSQYLGRRCD